MSDSTNQTAPETGEKTGWWGRLAGGLKRTSSALATTLDNLVNKRPLDPAMLDEIEEALIRTDLGIEAAARVTDAIQAGRFKENPTADEVKAIIADEVAKVLEPVAKPLVVTGAKPFVILVVGVNGSGKTTTIGKLVSKLSAEGRKVVLGAGDTFRAAAIDQLKIWGQRRHARQAEPQCIEIILQACPAFRAFVHGKAGRLVDDQHQPVAVEQPAPHLFRRQVFQQRLFR